MLPPVVSYYLYICTTVADFLGVKIDETLSGKPHIKYIEIKIAKILGIIHRTKHCLDKKKSLKMIYNSLKYILI